METVSCILCGSPTASEFLRQRDVNLGRTDELFTLVKCECGLIYLNPRPTRTEISKYYPEEYYPLEATPEPRKVDKFFKRLSNAQKKGIMVEFYGYPRPPGMSSNAVVSALQKLVL